MKADALMRLILSGNRSLEEFAVLLARISLGVFFAISGGNKLFVAGQYKLISLSG
jgi:putative oxidoreductase